LVSCHFSRSGGGPVRFCSVLSKAPSLADPVARLFGRIDTIIARAGVLENAAEFSAGKLMPAWLPGKADVAQSGREVAM
jgi:hypothetical protein